VTDDRRELGVPVIGRAERLIRGHPQSFSRSQISLAARKAFSVSANVCAPFLSVSTYHSHLPSAGFSAASIDLRLGARSVSAASLHFVVL
jgi:hypothetical protein